jgi:hypothetical protein
LRTAFRKRGLEVLEVALDVSAAKAEGDPVAQRPTPFLLDPASPARHELTVAARTSLE